MTQARTFNPERGRELPDAAACRDKATAARAATAAAITQHAHQTQERTEGGRLYSGACARTTANIVACSAMTGYS